MPKNITAYGQISASSIALSSTTASTSSTTGALVVPGGIGIGGDINVAGTITGGSVVYASTSSGTFSVTNGTGTTLTVASTTQSTSVGTGSAVFEGGVSIAGNLYIGGTVVAGSITYASTSTGTLTVTTTPGTTMQVDSVEDSTTRANGSAIFAGGIGVQKRVNVGSVRAFDTTQSTSITTGSGIFDGGVGVAGNIYTGGTVNSAGVVSTGVVTATGIVTSGGFDFIFGNANQVLRGDSGQSRALVKLDPAILAINYNGDFTGGVTIQGLTDSTSATTGAVRIPGGASVEKNFYVGGQLHSLTSVTAPTTNTALLNVTGTTDSTSIGTGTIINPGGLSNAKNITTLTLRTTGTTNSTSTTTGSIILSNGGGIGCAGNIYVGGVLNSATITTGAITNTTITASGNISGATVTGSSLVSTGGVSVTGTATMATLTVSGTGTIATLNGTGTNTLNIIVGTSTTESTAIGVGGTQLAGGLSVAKNYSGASAHLYSTGDSANKGDGVLIVDGGMGVNKRINGGSIRVWDTTEATSSSVAAAIVDGGLGVAKNINCDGNIRNGGFDFILGNTSNARGDSGSSRAVIKDFGNELVFNFLGDYTGGSRMDSKLRITNTNNAASDLTSSIYTLGGIRAAKNIWCGGYDFVLGNENQVDRGNSGQSRALVKVDPSILVINFDGDFTGGVAIQGLTDSTSATTGAVRIQGGASVEKNFWGGDEINALDRLRGLNLQTWNLGTITGTTAGGTFNGNLSGSGVYLQRFGEFWCLDVLYKFTNVSGSNVSFSLSFETPIQLFQNQRIDVGQYVMEFNYLGSIQSMFSGSTIIRQDFLNPNYRYILYFFYENWNGVTSFPPNNADLIKVTDESLDFEYNLRAKYLFRLYDIVQHILP